MKARVILASAVCLLVALAALFLHRVPRSGEGVGDVNPASPEMDPDSASVRTQISTDVPSARDALVHFRVVRVVDTEGAPISGAALFLCEQIERVSRVTERRALGETGADGRLPVPERTLLDSPGACVSARARGFLPASLPVAEVGSDGATLVLGRELRQAIRCTDLQGDPVPGVAVKLSRFPILGKDRETGVDPDVEQGFDPVDSLRALETDAQGLVEFGELLPGRYRLVVVSSCHARVDREGPSIVVPGPRFEVRLTTMLCGVIHVVGDEVYNWMCTPDAPFEFAGSSENPASPWKRLRAAYPDDVVVVGANKSSSATISSVPVDVFLARTGKLHVELPLAPACQGRNPFVVEVPADSSGQEAMATVKFEIRDVTGRSIPCPWFEVRKDQGGIPMGTSIRLIEPQRLPFGRWTIYANDEVFEEHFRPVTLEVAHSEESVLIQLDLQLVPVRIVARGYRGRSPIGGRVVTTQLKINDTQSALEQNDYTIWLRPGDTEWYFGSDGYNARRWSEPVRVMPNGEPQTIEFDLEVGENH